MIGLAVICSVAFIIVYQVYLQRPVRKRILLRPTPPAWKEILHRYVNFYRGLDEGKKLQFEADIQRFLGEVTITGVQTEVDLTDRLLVASSAVIPLFGFPAWNYKYLDEVILYPSSFDRDFNFDNPWEQITGMVGGHGMEGKVILSKPALREGFEIFNDKNNVGIHEFVHLFDKETGTIDAIPPGFENKSFALPWLSFIQKKMEEIETRQSDIHPYAASDKVEFFAVASEYFFERPHLLKKKHPELYQRLQRIFNQDLTAVIHPSSFKKLEETGRNDPCICGSGLKYKKCCGSS